MTKSTNKQEEKVSKSKKHTLGLGIGLGLVLPICVSAIAGTVAYFTAKNPETVDYKLIIADGPLEGQELPTSIQLNQYVPLKTYDIFLMCDEKVSEIKEIKIISTNVEKFNATATKNSSTWTLDVFATKDAVVEDLADITLVINNTANKQIKYTINTWLESTTVKPNIIKFNGVDYELEKEIDPNLFITCDPNTQKPWTVTYPLKTGGKLEIDYSEDADKLTNLIIGSVDFTKPTIGDNFLANCTELVNVDLFGLKTIVSVGNNFLYNCLNLESVDLSAMIKLEEVGTELLNECSNVTEIYLPDTTQIAELTSWGNYIGANALSEIITIDCGSLESKTAYMNDTVWANLTTTGGKELVWLPIE